MHLTPASSIQQKTVIHHSKTIDHNYSTNITDSNKYLFFKSSQAEAKPITISNKNCTIIDINKIPTVQLADGSIVDDYSQDTNFATKMEQMSLEQAEAIRTQINKYPNEFPMPCMAITAKKIQTSLQQLKQHFCLTAIEKQILNQLEIELSILSPKYPYKQSLIVTYKYLLYKSFLEFQFHLEALNINIKDNIELRKIYLPGEENAEIMKVLEYLSSAFTDKPLFSIFFSECTLTKIKNLPWDSLLSKNIYFIYELSKIYFSLAVNRTLDSAFYALSSDEILIPYTNELSVEFFNKTWFLPLWLVGCSLNESLITVDGFYMGSSAFFEHDLFHLSSKLDNLANKQPFFAYMLKQIRLIYQNKQLLKNINLEAIELAIFYVFHEIGMNNTVADFKSTLEDIANNSHFLPMYSLPIKYKLVSSIDLKISCYFLSEILLNNNQNANFISNLLKAENNTKTKHLLDIETSSQQVYYDIYYKNPIFINEIIKDIISNKTLLKNNNYNPSCLVAIMNGYIEVMQDKINNNFLDSSTYLQQQTLDKLALYQLIKDKRNSDWLICFSNSDKTLSSSERCKIACNMVQKNLIICL